MNQSVFSSGPRDLIFTAERCLKLADTWDLERVVKTERWKNLVTYCVNICSFKKSSDLQLLNFFRKLLCFIPPLQREETIRSHMRVRKKILFNCWLKSKREEHRGEIFLLDLFEIIDAWRTIKISIAEEISDTVIAVFALTMNEMILISDGSSPPTSDLASSVVTSVTDNFKIKSSPTTVPKFDETESSSHGYLIFINNYKYGVLEDRIGHEKDSERLRDVARKLGFSFRELTNLDSCRVIEELKQFTESVRIHPSQKLIIAVGSHGYRDSLTNEDFIACHVEHDYQERSDLSRLKVDDIIKIIEEGEDYEPVQKLFLLHFCRQLRENDYSKCRLSGVDETVHLPGMPDVTDNWSDKEKVHFPSLRTCQRTLGKSENSWIVFSALPGDLAYRTENGSFLLEDFCEVLGKSTGPVSCTELLEKMSVNLDERMEKLDSDVQRSWKESIFLCAL